MSPLVHHERAQELDHDLAVLLEAGRPHADDPDVGSRFRFALLQDLAARVYGVALEERIRQPDFVPAEVGHYVERQINRRLPGDQRKGERRVDERSAELGLRRIGMVEVNGIHVLGE